MKRDIESAADEIKSSAFDTFTAADKLVTGARIVVEIDAECAVNVRYETDCIPRGILCRKSHAKSND